MHSFLCYCRTSLSCWRFPTDTDVIDFDFFDIVDINMKKHKLSHVFFYDIYRTPIERKISAFFEHLKSDVLRNPKPLIDNLKRNPYLYSFDVSSLNVKNFETTIRNKIDLLIEIFWWNFMINTDNYYSFQEYKGIEKFNIESKPYFYQDNGKYKYIVLKFKHIRQFHEHLFEIHGEKFSIQNTNITSQDSKQGVNDMYTEFKEKFTIPLVLFKLIFFKDHQMHPLHHVCNHYQVMKQFENDEEINGYIRYWKSKSNDIIPEYIFTDELSSDEIYSQVVDYFKKNPRLNVFHPHPNPTGC